MASSLVPCKLNAIKLRPTMQDYAIQSNIYVIPLGGDSTVISAEWLTKLHILRKKIDFCKGFNVGTCTLPIAAFRNKDGMGEHH